MRRRYTFCLLYPCVSSSLFTPFGLFCVQFWYRSSPYSCRPYPCAYGTLRCGPVSPQSAGRSTGTRLRLPRWPMPPSIRLPLSDLCVRQLSLRLTYNRMLSIPIILKSILNNFSFLSATISPKFDIDDWLVRQNISDHWRKYTGVYIFAIIATTNNKSSKLFCKAMGQHISWCYWIYYLLLNFYCSIFKALSKVEYCVSGKVISIKNEQVFILELQHQKYFVHGK